jgi:hypothetical protein
MLEKPSKPLKGFAEDVIFDNLSKTSHILFKSQGGLKLYFCHICSTGHPDLSKVIVGTFGASTMHRHMKACWSYLSSHHRIDC